MKANPNKLNHRGTSAVPVFGRVVLAVLESFTFSLDFAGVEGVQGCVFFDRLPPSLPPFTGTDIFS